MHIHELDEGDECSLAIRVWVQAPIDQSTRTASLLITDENDGITLTYDYAMRDLTIRGGETMDGFIDLASIEDKTVLSSRGIEIYTVASFDITITGTENPVLSEMILMLVENIE